MLDRCWRLQSCNNHLAGPSLNDASPMQSRALSGRHCYNSEASKNLSAHCCHETCPPGRLQICRVSLEGLAHGLLLLKYHSSFHLWAYLNMKRSCGRSFLCWEVEAPIQRSSLLEVFRIPLADPNCVSRQFWLSIAHIALLFGMGGSVN